jgi:hypothetical protein
MVFHGEADKIRFDDLSRSHGLGARVLLTSSVSSMENVPALLLPQDASILQKPFQPGELYAAVEAKLFRVPATILQE